jgi:hypothetical protein
MCAGCNPLAEGKWLRAVCFKDEARFSGLASPVVESASRQTVADTPDTFTHIDQASQ